MKIIKLFLLVGLAVLLTAMPFAGQATKDQASENIYIGPNEVLTKNIFKGGNSIIIEGEIIGDIYVAGNVIKISGPIRGSVFAVGNNINISGIVEGSVLAVGSNIAISGNINDSVRAFGSNVVIDSKITKNVFGIGPSLTLSNNSSVGWDVFLAGANINISGQINRNAEIYSANATIDGEIKGNIKTEIDPKGTFVLLPNANIGGDINYKANADDQLFINEGAMVVGSTNFSEFEKIEKEKAFINLMSFFTITRLISLFGLIVVGLMLISLSPKIITQEVENAKSKPWASIGWGLLTVVFTPILLLILMITIIGIPLALILLPIYFIVMYLAQLVVVFVIGDAIIIRIIKNKQINLSWALIAGTIVFYLIASIPIIGWVLKIIAIWWGVGAMLITKKELLMKINK